MSRPPPSFPKLEKFYSEGEDELSAFLEVLTVYKELERRVETRASVLAKQIATAEGDTFVAKEYHFCSMEIEGDFIRVELEGFAGGDRDVESFTFPVVVLGFDDEKTTAYVKERERIKNDELAADKRHREDAVRRAKEAQFEALKKELGR